MSAPGSILITTTLVKSLQRRCSSQHPDLALSKQVRTIVAARQCDAQTIEFSGAFTLSGKAYGNLVLQATLPKMKKHPCVASTFLENVLPLQS